MVRISENIIPQTTIAALASNLTWDCGFEEWMYACRLTGDPTGSNGPEGLDEFIASYQSTSSKGSKRGHSDGKESFREDVSRTANPSLPTSAQDVLA